MAPKELGKIDIVTSSPPSLMGEWGSEKINDKIR
jgi:hypothetical protein